MKYNLCISIPIKYTSIKEVRPLIEKAVKSKPNLIELRFDYISNIKTFSVDFVRDLLNIIHPHAAVIFTLRDSSEGGQLKIHQKERLKILKMLIEPKPDYIDIEMNTDYSFLNEIIKLASQKGVNIIFSNHNLERTLTYEEAITLIHKFNDTVIQKFAQDPERYQNYIYKVIFTAHTFEDNIIPLRLCKQFSNSSQKLISFCMGPMGIFSRIMCVSLGSFLTYASLEEKTAPGQITIDKMREIYDLFPNNH